MLIGMCDSLAIKLLAFILFPYTFRISLLLLLLDHLRREDGLSFFFSCEINAREARIQAFQKNETNIPLSSCLMLLILSIKSRELLTEKSTREVIRLN